LNEGGLVVEVRFTLRQTLRVSLLLLAALAFAPAYAGSDEVIVDEAWSRASIGTSRPGVVYMTIRNEGNESRKLGAVTTDLAARAEIHQTSTNERGVSSMSRVEELEVPAGSSVALEPGGLHVMLMGLQRSMKRGESFSLTLVLDEGVVEVEVPILGFTSRGPER
jgi:hypothetical protein